MNRFSMPNLQELWRFMVFKRLDPFFRSGTASDLHPELRLVLVHVPYLTALLSYLGLFGRRAALSKLAFGFVLWAILIFFCHLSILSV